MIHLTIQDVALLANLADCCNTVDEFVEYLNKTHAWGTTPLSARQDHDGEFVVSYGTIDNIQYEPTDYQFASAYNTIDKLKFSPGAIDYRVDSVVGVEGLMYINDARKSADYAALLYAGILKLKFDRSTDYRVNSISSILKLKYRQTVPFSVVYGTIGSLTSNVPDDRCMKAGGYTTLGNVSMRQSGNRDGYYPGVVSNYKTLESVTFTRSTGVKMEPAVIYTTLEGVDNYRWSPGEIKTGFGVSYDTIGRIDHNRWDESDMPVDQGITYKTIGRIYHHRWSESDTPVDQPVSYSTIGRIDHNRWDESDMPVDQGITYNTIGRLDHNRWDESDMPIDQPVSYSTVGRIDHNRWDESDMPIDQPVSYNTIGRLDHNRWDESDMPIDQPVSYNTIGRLEHNRWDESDMPIDGGVIYYTITQLQSVAWRDAALRQDKSVNYETLSKIKTFNVNVGISYHTVSEYKTIDSEANKAMVYSTLSDVTYYFPDDTKTYTYKTLAYVNDQPINLKVYTYFNLSEVLYRFPDDGKFCIYTTLNGIDYKFPDDGKLYMYNTLNHVKFQNPGDVKVQMYNTLQNMSWNQHNVDNNHTYTTITNIASTEPASSAADYNTIDTLYSDLTGGNEHPYSYQTISKIEHEPCTNVHCSDKTFTWATTCFDTSLDQYGPWRATYGISKFKIFATSNTLHEIYVGPWNTRSVRVSDIRARLWNDKLYPLNDESVTIRNEGGCILGSHQLSSVISGVLQTTTDQITAQQDAVVVYGDDLVLSFHLSAPAPIKQIEIAPGGYNGEPKNFPGGIRIDCFTPGAGDWYTVYRKQTMMHAISGMTDYNSRSNVWTPGKYFKFPILDNSQLYLSNHTSSPSFCPI